MKEYLDGKIKLKEPTLEMMCEIGEIIQTYSIPSVLAGSGLKHLLGIICEGDVELLMKSNPKESKQILQDFFTIWKPLEWIFANTSTLPKSKKSLQELRAASRNIKKP